MPKTISLSHILFLDIETVPEQPSFEKLSIDMQQLFEQKTAYQRGEDQTVESFYSRAGIWAEFGKIVCISVGFFDAYAESRSFRVKSFYGVDEAKILEDFKQLLDQYFNQAQHVLCAHNGKEFDFPYLARRMIIHGMTLPDKLQLFGKKPWEIPHLDTMEMWKFGDYKHYTSLNLLTKILNVPSPKEDIDGSMVAQVYYQDKDLKRIANYCENDTIAVAQVYLRFLNQPILNQDEILSKT